MMNALTVSQAMKFAAVVHRRGPNQRFDDFILQYCMLVDKHDSFSVKVEIDPEMAGYLLNHNPHNRIPSAAHIKNLGTDVQEGRFKLNGETIIISPEGELVDGQNRLRAVVATGKSIVTFVVFGIPVDMRATIGVGRAWTLGHILSAQGVKHYLTVAAMAGFLASYAEHGTMVTNSGRKATKSKLEEYVLARQSDLEHSAGVAIAARGKLVNGTLLGTMHRILLDYTNATAGEARAFIDAVSLGEELMPNDPVQVFRDLMAAEGSGRLREPNRRYEAIFRTWNACRRGEPSTLSVSALTGTLPPLEK